MLFNCNIKLILILSYSDYLFILTNINRNLYYLTVNIKVGYSTIILNYY